MQSNYSGPPPVIADATSHLVSSDEDAAVSVADNNSSQGEQLVQQLCSEKESLDGQRSRLSKCSLALMVVTGLSGLGAICALVHGPPHHFREHGMDGEHKPFFEGDEPHHGGEGKHHHLKAGRFEDQFEMPDSGFYAIKKRPEEGHHKRGGHGKWNKGEKDGSADHHNGWVDGFATEGEHEGGHHGKKGGHHEEGDKPWKGPKIGRLMKRGAIMSLIFNALLFCAALCGYKATKLEKQEDIQKSYKKSIIMLLLSIPFAFKLAKVDYKLHKKFLNHDGKLDKQLDALIDFNDKAHEAMENIQNEEFNRHHKRQLSAKSDKIMDFLDQYENKKNGKHHEKHEAAKDMDHSKKFEHKQHEAHEFKTSEEIKKGIVRRLAVCIVAVKFTIVASLLALYTYFFKSFKSGFISFQKTNELYNESIDEFDEEDRENMFEEITEANEVRKAKEQQSTIKVVPVQTIQQPLYQYIPPVIAPDALNSAYMVQAAPEKQQVPQAYPTLYQAPVAQAPVKRPVQPQQQQTYSLEQVKQLLDLERERNVL